MGEPIIYNPSIYKGPTVYNNGGGGGGGGGDEYVEIGGKKYTTLNIGGDIWLAQNLDYIDSSMLVNQGTLPTTPAVWYQDNYSRIAYGVLYNWYAIRNLNIPGWRVPKNSDYNTLISTIGYGNAVKSILWGGSGDNKFGAMPSGWHGSNGFNDLGIISAFWSYDELGSSEGFLWDTTRNGVNYDDKRSAYAIRLIKT